ncbi:MAG TPA: hypothetical protein VGH86_05370, partial [Phenylobacterium sp.]
PKVFNLRMDPFERADSVAAAYDTWAVRHAFTIVPTQAVVAKFVATFQAYPPRQRPATFNVNRMLERIGAKP